MDHFAFRYVFEDFEPVRKTFEQTDTPYYYQVLLGFGLRQLSVKDPDGVRMEMNFPAS